MTLPVGRGLVARATHALRAVRAAFAFLTRLPVGGYPYTPAEWSSAPAYFPLVGLLLGVLFASAFAALRPLGGLVQEQSADLLEGRLAGQLQEPLVGAVEGVRQ